MQTVDVNHSFEIKNHTTNDQPPSSLQAEGSALLMQGNPGPANMARIANQTADLVKAGVLPEHCCPNTTYKFDPKDLNNFVDGHKGPAIEGSGGGASGIAKLGEGLSGAAGGLGKGGHAPAVDASTGASGGGDSNGGSGGGGAKGESSLSTSLNHKMNEMHCDSDNMTISHHNDNVGHRVPIDLTQPHGYK